MQTKLGKTLGNLRTMQKAQMIDDLLVNRIASKTTSCVIFLLLILFWAGFIFAGVKLKIFNVLPAAIGLITMMTVFFGPIILAGLFHNWFQKKIWQIIFRIIRKKQSPQHK